MRRKMVVVGLTVTALIAAVPAYAQSTATDKPQSSRVAQQPGVENGQ